MRRRLRIKAFCLGQWATNCYVVHTVSSQAVSESPLSDDAENGSPHGGPNLTPDQKHESPQPETAWIIDAGFDPHDMIQYVRARDLLLEKVILTHAHVDHIAGLAEVRSAWPEVPILIHQAEQSFLANPALNLSSALDRPIVAPQANQSLEHGQTLSLGGLTFEIRHTPGHSPGGVTLYQHNIGVAFAGDALFAGSIGRTDFPTSDHDALLTSIQDQLLTLPDHTRVLSGHGPPTTIGQEKAQNPYL